ncbi:MAG: HD domain-containing protein [bacterium]
MKKFVQKIANLGGSVFLVGGAVRDLLLGLVPKDRDYCVTGVTVEAFTSAFPKAELVGKDFPVFLLEVDGEVSEVAFARTERKSGKGHQGFDVFTSPEVTIEEDLLRRDLTINAMAKNLVTGEIIDPFEGQKDLHNGIIRATSSAFAEDPLRVLRAARFAARYGFVIEERTLEMMSSLRGELSELSVERVFVELSKTLEQAKRPSVFFRVLKAAKVLDVHFPEVADLVGVPQPEKHHPEGDAFEHSLQVLDEASKLSQEPVVRFAALAHDLGKAVTPNDVLPSHHGHGKAGVPIVQAMALRLKLPVAWSKAACAAAELHMKAHLVTKMRPGKLVDLLTAAHKSQLGVHGLVVVSLADERGRNNSGAEAPHLHQLPAIASEMFSVVNGKVVELPKRPAAGVQLRQLRAQWVANNVSF